MRDVTRLHARAKRRVAITPIPTPAQLVWLAILEAEMTPGGCSTSAPVCSIGAGRGSEDR